MAKMKIFEIARSIQAKNKEIKSGDLVKLLNDNGFDVKGYNSNIEDKEIAFLLQTFNDPEKVKKILASQKEEKPENEEPKKVTKEETKEEKTKVEEKKEVISTKEEPKKDILKEEKTEDADKSPEVTQKEKKNVQQEHKKEKKEENQLNVPEAEPKKTMPEKKKNVNHSSNSNTNDRRGDNNRGDRRQNRNANNRGERRQNNNGGDRRGNNRGDRGQGNNARNGEKVFERFEKAQSGFDGIKQEQKNSRKRNKKPADKGTYKKSTKEEMSRIRSKKDPNRKGAFIKPEPVVKEPEETIKQITIPESLTIRELADKMKMPPAALVKKLFLQGQVVSLNQDISFEEAEEIALEFDIIAEKEEKIDMVAELLKEEEEPEEEMRKRPPVVCVMGHVDHGKTSLLDAIREANVTSHEAGGITQHIGAYVVEINGEKITFLDTPGHEAFTSMRMRGAQSTDIAILVVAADDGVMPQTVEAINHAKAAGVEIIVAINKIDKEGANIERVKQELAEYELIPEDWGGSTVFVPVSAHTKEGIEQLLEMIVLTSEVLELKANPNRKARGIVIEARLDKGRGPVATVLVQKGTLRIGDHVAVGPAHGKVRAMIDHNGERVKVATPSTPVEILGLSGAPDAGEIFVATESDKEAKQISQAYIDQSKDKLLEETKAKKLSLDGLFNQIQAGNVKDLNLIIKADVQGSVEAVKQSLLKLGNEEVAVRVIHGGVGAITESDVSLASASNAIIIGFNIRPDNTAKEVAERENVDVRLYRVIYDAIEDIENALKGMLEPIYEEKVIGHVEVRQTFKASGVGTIAGSYVLDGKVQRGCKCRVYRGDDMIFEGDLASLKRFKDDVKEVAAGYECGLVFSNFNDVQMEDRVECYIMVEVPR
ncbi:MAG: translation initiation factor IF-2 [Clostridiales bacterium]|nr:translation initiation factor IF-2 [Clostridiales bacterium]